MKFLRWIGARFLQKGTKALGSNVYQLLQEAHAHLQLEKYDEARSLLLQVLASRDSIKDPEAVRYALVALSSTWLLTEHYDDGIAFFSNYISRYPEDSPAYSSRAEALWYVGRLQEAIHDYSYALKMKPGDIRSLSGRGQVLAEAGEFGRAMEDLDLALQTLKTVSKPDSSWVQWCGQIEAFIHNGRGFALAGLGASGPAMEEFEQSINLSPENAWVYHNRAKVYDRAGNWEKASEDYQMALTKKSPKLNPIRTRQAQTRVQELSNRS